MQKKHFHYLLILLILGIVVLAAWPSSKEQDVLSINLKEHKNIQYHIHPKVEIEILGEKLIIPANIGISDQGMRVIHTHDDSGELHIEAPFPHQFYLKDFFTIWGKTFNKNCIMDTCVDENHTLEFLVNGFSRPEFEAYPLHDGDVLSIVYSEK